MRISTVKSHFWKWFSANAEHYFLFNTLSQKKMAYLIDEINIHLRAYCRYLEAILEKTSSTTARLAITANGRVSSFAKADRLVEKAPAIAHWEMVALEPPRDPAYMLDLLYPDIDIDPHRLWFADACDTAPGEKKAIIVYSEWYTPATDYRFEGAVRLIVQNILGERSAALDIGEIIPANCSDAPCKADLLRMEELPASVGHNLSYHFEVGAGGELRQKR